LRERFTTFIVVTVVTLTIWLYAEAESLGARTETAAVEFSAGSSSDLEVAVTDNEWNGQVRVQLSGSRSALERARNALESRVVVQAGTLGLPDADSDTRLKLIEVLRRYEPLAGTGVTIESADPPHVGVQVRRLIVAQAPIRAEVPGVQIAGDITLNPDRAELRVPERLWAEIGAGLQIVARPTAEQLTQLPASGAVSIAVTLAAPPGVQLRTTRATLNFSVKSTLATGTFAVPIQILLPSVELNDWVVSIDGGNDFIDVEVSAPADYIERLRSPSEGLIAVMSLSSDDLAQGRDSKDVGFAVLRQGVATPLPEFVTVNTETRTVRFTAARRELP